MELNLLVKNATMDFLYFLHIDVLNTPPSEYAKYSLTTGLVFLATGNPKTQFLPLNGMGKREIDVEFYT